MRETTVKVKEPTEAGWSSASNCGATHRERCYLVMEHGDSQQGADVGPPQEKDRWKS